MVELNEDDKIAIGLVSGRVGLVVISIIGLFIVNYLYHRYNNIDTSTSIVGLDKSSAINVTTKSIILFSILYSIGVGFYYLYKNINETHPENINYLLSAVVFISILIIGIIGHDYAGINFNWVYNNISIPFNQLIQQITTTITEKWKEVFSIGLNEELNSGLLQYGFLYGFLLFIVVIFYIASADPHSLTTNASYYSFIIIVPLLLLVYYIMPSSMGGSSFMDYIIPATGVFSLVIFGYYYSTLQMTTTSNSIIQYLFTFLLGLIWIFGMALLFLFTSNYLKSTQGWSSFFVYFLFYIPCLAIDFFQYIRRELAITTNVVYILFFVELICVFLYMYGPTLLSLLFKKQGVVLLKEPQFLNREITLKGTNEIVLEESGEEGEGEPVFKTDYAISMWLYLNPQPSNFTAYSKETPIFCYGLNGKGKPLITYYNDMNEPERGEDYKDKLLFYFNPSSSKPDTTITLPKQRWNYIVIQYKNNICDVFVNGELDSSTPLSMDTQPEYNLGDTFTIGSHEGLDGAICNIQYFFEPLTTMNMLQVYNVLSSRNPPVPIDMG